MVKRTSSVIEEGTGDAGGKRVSGPLPRADTPVGAGTCPSASPEVMQAAKSCAGGDGCLSVLFRCRRTGCKLDCAVADQGGQPGVKSAVQSEPTMG